MRQEILIYKSLNGIRKIPVICSDNINKTITLTPDQYSIVDEPKLIPETCEIKGDKP